MAEVIASEPESATVAAAPAWTAEIRKYAVEAIGAFFLTFVVVVSVLSRSVYTPLAAGAALMVMIYAGGHISGGHYNPAVTMAALVRGRIGIVEAVRLLDRADSRRRGRRGDGPRRRQPPGSPRP